MFLSGGGIKAGWEWGEVARRVWAGSICSRRGSVCAVLRRAGLSVSEEKRLIGTREPPGGSAPHADGRDESVRSLPHCGSHQPAGQLRPSSAQAWKIWQRGTDDDVIKKINKYRHLWGSEFHLFPSGHHWSSHVAAEKGHLVCSVCEHARLSQCGLDGACTENYRLCRSRPQRPVQRGRHARYTGKLKGKYRSQIIEQKI